MLERDIDQRRVRNNLDFSMVQDFMYVYFQSHPKMRWKDLAGRAGLDASTISKYKNGQCRSMQKASAIRLAISMELDWEQMQNLIHAAGYTFPYDELDYAIKEIFMKNQGQSIRYRDFLFIADQHPVFSAFLDAWFG